MHGGVDKGDLQQADAGAVKRGFANLARHIRNVGQFGVPAVVAINRFPTDTDEELEVVKALCAELSVDALECNHWAEGGAGAEALAKAVVEIAESGHSQFRPLYDDSMSLWEKASHIATGIYEADEIIADKKVRDQFKQYQQDYGHFQVCMAKTQYSFSTDPNLLGAPSHHSVPIREIRLAAGRRNF